MFAGTRVPENWEFCNGQLLPIDQNQALYSIIGRNYGGDGVTNFKLPDFRGRVCVQAGTGPGLSNYYMGEAGGREQVYLTVDNLPSHSHAVTDTLSASVGVADDDGNTQDVANNVIANSPSEEYFSTATPDAQLGGVKLTGSVTVQNTGGSLPYDNRVPYLAAMYIICTDGTYPTFQ